MLLQAAAASKNTSLPTKTLGSFICVLIPLASICCVILLETTFDIFCVVGGRGGGGVDEILDHCSASRATEEHCLSKPYAKAML